MAVFDAYLWLKNHPNGKIKQVLTYRRIFQCHLDNPPPYFKVAGCNYDVRLRYTCTRAALWSVRTLGLRFGV